MPRHARRFVKQGEPLPDTDVHSESFRQTRAARHGALAEDYVELIADLIDNGNEARQVEIAARLGVSQPTVAKMASSNLPTEAIHARRFGKCVPPDQVR